MLLGPQDVPRPADLQVPHGDAEAGAEGGELPDGRQPLFPHLGEDTAPAEGEVGVGPAGAPAHPAP